MRVTWFGHATAAVRLGDAEVLTDPALTARLAHLTRVRGTLPAARLTADLVLISHLHADHLHVPSLRRVRAGRAIVPAGGESLATRAGIPRVDSVQEGQQVRVGAVSVTAVPAAHDGRRLPGSRLRGPALGYVLEHAGRRVWFAGDTGLFAAMADLGPVDVALVPVGGWGPTLGPGHLDPEQAVEAVARVGARHAVPIHYGTYWPAGLRPLAPDTYRRMCREPGERFAAAITARGLDTRVHVLAPGGTVELGDG